MRKLLSIGFAGLVALGGAGCQTASMGEPHTRAGYWAGMGYYKPPAAVGPQSISVVGMDHTSAIGSPETVAVPPAEPTVMLSQRSRLLSRSRNVATSLAPADPCATADDVNARLARIEVILKNCLPQTPPPAAQKMPAGQE